MAGGNAIRGSRVGAGPMGEAERGDAAPRTQTALELFAVYVGEGIDSGRKSLALGLTFQDLSRTLTDTDVEDAVGKVLQALGKKFGAGK